MNNLRNVFFAIGEFIFYLYCDNRNNKVFCLEVLEVGTPMTEDEVVKYGIEIIQHEYYFIESEYE